MDLGLGGLDRTVRLVMDGMVEKIGIDPITLSPIEQGLVDRCSIRRRHITVNLPHHLAVNLTYRFARINGHAKYNGISNIPAEHVMYLPQ